MWFTSKRFSMSVKLSVYHCPALLAKTSVGCDLRTFFWKIFGNGQTAHEPFCWGFWTNFNRRWWWTRHQVICNVKQWDETPRWLGIARGLLGVAWGCLGLLGVDAIVCHSAVLVSNNATPINPKQTPNNPEQTNETTSFGCSGFTWGLLGVQPKQPRATSSNPEQPPGFNLTPD